VEIKPGVWLYSLPMDVESGLHKIWVSGALETEIEFAVGVNSPPYEYYVDFEGIYLNPWAFVLGYVLVGIFNMFVLVGVVACGWFVRWLESVSNWLLFVAVSPLLIGCGLRKLRKWIQAVFVVAVVWGMALPVGFFYIEGHLAIMWPLGYLIDVQFVPDLMFPMWSVIYLGMVVQSFLIVLSLNTHQFERLFVVDFVVAGLLFFGSEAIWVIVGGKLANKLMWLSSIEFVVFPVIFSGTVVAVYRTRKVPLIDNLTSGEIHVHDTGETSPSDLLLTWRSEGDGEALM
jgi:hypothetical protein